MKRCPRHIWRFIGETYVARGYGAERNVLEYQCVRCRKRKRIATWRQSEFESSNPMATDMGDGLEGR